MQNVRTAACVVKRADCTTLPEVKRAHCTFAVSISPLQAINGCEVEDAAREEALEAYLCVLDGKSASALLFDESALHALYDFLLTTKARAQPSLRSRDAPLPLSPLGFALAAASIS